MKAIGFLLHCIQAFIRINCKNVGNSVLAFFEGLSSGPVRGRILLIFRFIFVFSVSTVTCLGGCGSVDRLLVFESGGSKFESHCSQHVVVSLGQDTSPQIAPVGIVHSTECM